MVISTHIYRWIVLLLTCFLSLGTIAQFDIPPKPDTKSQTAVYDYINLLTADQNRVLSNKLIRYADSTSTQIVVVIIASTQGEDISFLGAKWGQAWGIGQSDKDNGILILLAKDDREIDINTGYGIETVITDRMAEQIINRIMIPSFKNENYYEGLDEGTTALIKALEGEYEENRTFEENNIPIGLIVLIIFIILMILFRNRNKKNDNHRGNKRGGSLLDMIILSQLGRSSGYGGGSSGSSWGRGGFGGGFGGGGFGGGGASGSW